MHNIYRSLLNMLTLLQKIDQSVRNGRPVLVRLYQQQDRNNTVESSPPGFQNYVAIHGKVAWRALRKVIHKAIFVECVP